MTHCFFFFLFIVSLGFKQCFSLAYKESLLPRLFLPVSVRAGWPLEPGHEECLIHLTGAHWGSCFVFGARMSLFQDLPCNSWEGPFVSISSSMTVCITGSIFVLGAFIETRKTDNGGHSHIME